MKTKTKRTNHKRSSRHLEPLVIPPQLSLKPQKTKDNTSWYYEEKNGIDVIHEVYGMDDKYIQTDHIHISFRRLKTSIDRIEKVRAAV
jgi:hypothetical protein